MPDNVLRVGAEFDVGPIVAGAQQAVSSFQKLQETAAKMAAQLMADGETAQAATSALLNFGFTAKTVAAAMESLGFANREVAASTEEATVAMSGFERAAAMAGGRILGMEAGLGMAGGALARVAAFLPGLGTAFIYALPVALVSEIIDKIEQYEKALQKADREVKEFAISSDEMTGTIEKENLKLEDQILKLEHRPEQNMLKIGLIEAQEAAEKLSKSLGEGIQKANDLLNVGIGGAIFSLFTGGGRADEAQYSEPLQKIFDKIQDARQKLSELPPGSSANAINDGLKEQIGLYKQLQTALETDIRDMEAGQGSSDIHAKSIARFKEELIGATDAIRNLGLQEVTTDLTVKKSGLEDYAAHIKTIEDQVGKVAALNTEINDTRAHIAELSKQPVLNASAIAGARESLKALEIELDKSISAGFAKSQEEIVKSDAMWKKFYADRVAEATKVAAEETKLTEEGARRWAELMNHVSDQIVTRNIQNAKADAAATEEIFRKMAEQREAAGVGHAGVFLDEAKTGIAEKQMVELDVQISSTDDTIKRLKADMAAINTQPFISENDLKNLERYSQELRSMETLLQKLQTEHTKLAQTATTTWQDIRKAEDNALTAGFNTFNSQFVRMMETGQSFSKVMISAWNSMVGSFVTAVLKMGEQWIATELLKLEVTTTTNATITTQTLSQNLIQRFDNAKTAASKAMASTPFPLDLVVGPLVFAAALAFERGGVVPGMGAVPAIVHGGEMVLPSHISTGIQNMFAGNTSTTNRSSSANISMENHFHNQSDLSPSTVARLVMKGARQGKVGIRL